MDAVEAKPPVIVVLISGTGSNLQALIDEVRNENIPATIAAVISNKPGVEGLDRARKAEITAEVVDHTRFDQREEFDLNLIRAIDKYQPDLIVLAGFMRILTADFVKRYEGRLLNIHPSLLPKYPGLNTHQRALDAGDQHHGVTTHFVTADLDSGPNIIQAQVPVLPQDTPETLAARVREQEHVIYPITVKWFVQGRVKMLDHAAFLDGEPLPQSGLRLDSPNTLH
ncbi:MAG: phosphoribosylglycinamide formyltransferase [Oleiphilus sp.]|nr:MAG: phosphoribosylglycinamide formyltransferase [Oleiphilus sp.]